MLNENQTALGKSFSMYAILCTDGQIDIKAVINECRPQKWVPIFAYREKNEPDLPIIPLFYDQKTAKTFINRNLPKDWLKGVIYITPENLEWMKKQRWKLLEMTFPRLLKDLPVTFEFEIMNLIESPEIIIRR